MTTHSAADSETLMQLFVEGPTWDGNLVSKSGRDSLIDLGYADAVNGWNFLTYEGVLLAVELGETEGKSWTDQSWYRKATCR